MTIEVTPMTEADIDGAIDCIQRAFADDPYNNWVFDRENFSHPRNRASLRLRCHWGITNAIFHIARSPTSATPSRVLGVAMWLPPTPTSTPQSWSSYLASWQLWANQVWMNLTYGRGGLNTRRYWIWKAAQAAAQSEIWTDPQGYYFCNIVTVVPEAQGRGIGRALMGEVLRRADEEGRCCYLESSRKVPNMAIYERLGFGCKREMVCDDGGERIMLYCMVREPVGKKLVQKEGFESSSK